MKRIVSVWLPDWPVTVWSKAAGRSPPPDPATPFALVERTTRGLVLSAVNGAARGLGLNRGQTHADARAMVPHLMSAPAEPEADAAALRRLALWAERYAPLAAIDDSRPGQEGLFLDMTGGAHLFGGEACLVADIEDRLRAAGITAQAAIADSPGAAWALARFARHRPGMSRIAAPGASRDALAELPMEALRVGDEAVRLLHRFGLRRIGDLYPLPSHGLARRFRGEEGLEVVRRLDQALGRAAEALVAARPAPLYRVWQVYPEPLLDVAGVEHILPELIAALARQLEQGGVGARSVTLTAFRTDGRTTAISARLSAAGRSPAHLMRLLKEVGLERLDLGFGADAVMLAAGRTEAVPERQPDMTDAKDGADSALLAALLDRLAARLGDRAVGRPQASASHIPERSERWVRAAPEAPEPPGGESRLRPLLLLDPPEPVEALAELPDSAPARFTWRRVIHKVARAEGPERLSPEWWLPKRTLKEPRSRDYYVLEDDAGRRFWLFREGLYDRLEAGDIEVVEETGEDRRRAPEWWLHGVFA